MSDTVDQFDDLLGSPIAWRRLPSKNVGAGDRGGLMILNQTEVRMHNVQDIEQLAFILMHAFDLHIEKRLGIDAHPGEFSNDDGKPCLVGALNTEELLLKPRILRHRFQPLERVKIRNPPSPNGVRKQLRQGGVGL